jgi:thiamine-phosphate pyrophosphorylase
MPTHDETAVLRVLDAAANRAREGLRVVEDCVRFCLDDAHLSRLCKELRHELTTALACIPWSQRAAARDTANDVGTQLSTPSEQSRTDLAQVLAANAARIQDGLRSLEEFGKLVDSRMAAAIKQIRYRSYTVLKAAETARGSRQRLDGCRLCVITDGRGSPGEFDILVRSLVAAGVGAIQLRDKRLCDRELLGRARQLRELTRQTSTLAIVNDRPDLAAICQADGVHLGQDDVAVREARRIVGPRVLVGVSTHSIAQARQAVLDGADYLGVGPVFPSSTKQFAEFVGLELVRQVAAEISLPAFAIGGISAQNAHEVVAAGAVRVAVSGAIVGAADPAAAAAQVLAAISVTAANGVSPSDPTQLAQRQ